MFHKYKNVKILLNGNSIIASNAELSLQGSIEPLYRENDRYSEEFHPTNGINGSLRLDYLLTGQDFIRRFTATDTEIISGNFGGLYFNSGYLKNYSLSVSPNSPVSANAEIVFFTEMGGQFAPTFEKAPSGLILNSADLSYSNQSFTQIGNIDNIISFNYNFNSDIEPLYTEESINPARIAFGRKEVSAQLETDLLSGDLPISGKLVGLQVNFRHPELADIAETITISGYLHQRDLSTSINKSLTSTLSIKQNLIESLPIINSFTPLSGYTGSGVLVDGENFLNATNFIFNDYPASSFTVLSNTSISGVVPKGAITGPIKISNFAGLFQSATNFTVIQTPINVLNITPITGAIGNKVKISGNNFFRISDVRFSQADSPNFNVESENIIESEVPEFAAWDTVKVISSTRNLTGISTQNFVPVPRIDSFSPISGVSGQLVTFVGRGFSGITGLYFNGLTAPVTVMSNSGLSGAVPSGNVRGKIRFIGQSGVFAETASDFYPLARITGINPTQGRTGILISISGESFFKETMYSLGGIKYKVSFKDISGSFDRVSNILLTGIVPYGAKSGPVSIHDTGDSMYPSNYSFTVTNEPPIISSITPKSGKFNDWVSIFGSYFENTSNIYLSGAAQGVYTGLSGSNIVVDQFGSVAAFKTPNITGGSYDIILNTTAGSATGTQLFTVLVPPYISGFRPSSGVFGDTILLSGNNFYPNTRLFFETTGTECFIKSGTIGSPYTGLQFYVPQTTLESGRIIVNNTVSQVTGNYFSIIPLPIISGFTPTSGEYGKLVLVSGKGLSSITGVKLGDYTVNNLVKYGNTGFHFNIPEDSLSDYVNAYSVLGISASSSQFTVLYPPVVVSGFTPSVSRVNRTLFISGSRLHTAYEVRFSGDAEEIRVRNFESGYTGIGTTGIRVLIPSEARTGKIKVVNPSGFTQSQNILTILYNPTISGYIPSNSGAFNDNLTITGNNLSGYDYFLNTYSGLTQVLNQQVVGNTGVIFKVPREIVKGTVFASGDGEVINLLTNFNPIPTVTGFNSNILRTGDVLTVTGVNAYEIYSFIGISGENGYFSGIIDETGIYKNYNQLTGVGVNSPTGFSILSGVINGNYIGTGRLLLVSSADTSPSGFDTFTGGYTYSQINRLVSSQLFEISGSPIIYNFTPQSGGYLTNVTITGANLLRVTGVYIRSGSSVNSTGTILSQSMTGLTFNPQPNSLDWSGNIEVVSRYGNSTSSQYFRYIEQPQISGFTPIQGYNGQQVTITGSGLRDVHTLYFGSYTGSFTRGLSNGSYAITGIIPLINELPPRTVSLRVVNEAGSGVLGDFTIINQNATFVGLSDTPDTITGNYYLRGAPGNASLEFRSPQQVIDDITGLSRLGGTITGNLNITGNINLSGGWIYISGIPVGTGNGGGVGTPGGSDKQIQFNNNGTFGGANSLLWSGQGLYSNSGIFISGNPVITGFLEAFAYSLFVF